MGGWWVVGNRKAARGTGDSRPAESEVSGCNDKWEMTEYLPPDTYVGGWVGGWVGGCVHAHGPRQEGAWAGDAVWGALLS